MADHPGQNVPTSLLHGEGPTAVSLELELDWPPDHCSHLAGPWPLSPGAHHGAGQAQVLGGHIVPADTLGYNRHLEDTLCNKDNITRVLVKGVGISPISD